MSMNAAILKSFGIDAEAIQAGQRGVVEAAARLVRIERKLDRLLEILEGAEVSDGSSDNKG